MCILLVVYTSALFTLLLLALGSHIVKFLTILLVPLRDLCIVECVLLSVCPTVLVGNSTRAWSWVIRAVDRDESRRKTEYLQ